uniref:hypothetical protein n=1 Tax=Kocuria rosea TaxID=1275 RepID=UPI001C92FEBA
EGKVVRDVLERQGTGAALGNVRSPRGGKGIEERGFGVRIGGIEEEQGMVVGEGDGVVGVEE